MFSLSALRAIRLPVWELSQMTEFLRFGGGARAISSETRRGRFEMLSSPPGYTASRASTATHGLQSIPLNSGTGVRPTEMNKHWGALYIRDTGRSGGGR